MKADLEERLYYPIKITRDRLHEDSKVFIGLYLFGVLHNLIRNRYLFPFGSQFRVAIMKSALGPVETAFFLITGKFPDILNFKERDTEVDQQ